MEQFVTDGYQLVKLVDLVRNARKTSIQSTGMRDGLLYAFYHDSLIQTYKDGCLVEEFSPVGGDLFHANDCDPAGKDFWICDTGTDTFGPAIKRFDPIGRKVLESHEMGFAGWRTAAVSMMEDGSLLVVSVEAIDTHIRTKMMVSHVSADGHLLAHLGFVPMHHRFVQGCAREVDSLWISSNDGRDSATTRFVQVSIPTLRIIRDLHFTGFGEAEGLFRLPDGSFLVGRNHADGFVYLLEKL